MSRLLFLGIAPDGTRLAEARTGGMYYACMAWDYFRRRGRYEVDDDGISSLSARQLGVLTKLRLGSLYLLIARGRKRYKYIFVSGAWDCPAFLLWSKLRGSKIVAFWFHRTSIQPELATRDRVVWRLKEWCQLKIADHAIAISKSTLRSLTDLGFSGTDYVLAAPGLDKEVWVDRTSGYDPFKGGFRVLCVASIAPHKGIMDLLVAFADFLDTVRDVAERRAITLDIVGNDQVDPVSTTELRRVIEEHGLGGNVSLRGRRHLQELMGFYRHASVLVCPSHYEGWGMVVLEAASFGLPVIVSNGGSLPEVVNDGEYGLIYPTGDRAALRQLLERVYRDAGLRAALSAKAAELYRAALTWEQTGALIEAYLQ
ncbi:MAG: glycosyltransferase family 1 protein [Betaproteobacteria bacterium]|nr:MAG: glycosyltransferase family 1 protein [Betaproteobacteria bacterium]